MLATLRDGEDKLTTFDHDGFDRLSGSGAGGNDLIAQYDGSGVLQKRFVFAPGGEPLVAYDAAGNRTFLESDERGSVIALADDSGVNTAINTYDEYGIPSATNQGMFQYAGMLWLSGPGLYAPRYRSFNANQGRFNQTDPIGYAGGVNPYVYVLNDPVNLVDPLGLADRAINIPPCIEKEHQSCVTGSREPEQQELPASLTGGGRPNPTIIVTGRRRQKPQDLPLHYRIHDFAFCSADALFSEFRKPGGSAPEAPYAKEGTTPDVWLPGNNYITQHVDPVSRTIINVTGPKHIFYYGTVVISVIPTSFGSAVTIEGRGSGPYYWENRVFGKLLFTAISTRATTACSLGL